MTSIVGICNQAIARTGQSATIASLTEASVSARLCNTHYEQCRDEILQAFPWGFSTKRIDLALVGEELVTHWQYCYHYPSNCLKIFQIVSASRNDPTLDETVPYEVANYADEKVILTNEASAWVVYAAAVTDVNLFSPLVAKALSALLASRIAFPLTGKADIAQKCEQDYLRAVHEAAQADLNESKPGRAADCDLITGRE